MAMVSTSVAASSASDALSAALRSGDITTALMAVQTQRTQELDRQLTAQISAVDAKNKEAQLLNTAMAALNTVLAAYPKNAEPDDTIPDWNQAKIDSLEKPLNDALVAAGLTNMNTDGGVGEGQVSKGQNIFGSSVFRGDRTNVDAKQMQSQLQGKLDNVNSSTQMDMMKLQSLSNKRNEAFDVMTNFMKKEQDSKSAIIANIR